MSLLDFVKEAKPAVEFGNESLPTGNYVGKLVDVKHDTIKEQYEVYRFWYKVTTKDGDEAILTDTMFVSDDQEKTFKQLSFRIGLAYKAGAISDAAITKAEENLDGFIGYYVKQMARYKTTVRLYDDEYKGKKNRRVSLQKVEPLQAPATQNEDDLPF